MVVIVVRMDAQSRDSRLLHDLPVRIVRQPHDVLRALRGCDQCDLCFGQPTVKVDPVFASPVVVVVIKSQTSYDLLEVTT